MTHRQKSTKGAAQRVFVPLPRQVGVPKNATTLAPRACLPLNWPKESKARKEAFEAWHAVAMQVCNQAGVSFRVMAIVERFVHWNTGTFWATNETIAMRAGRCSERTIKRDMASICGLGLFIVERGWRRSRNGKLVRSRLIRLAIPKDLPVKTWIPGEIHGDTSCPYELLPVANDHGDTSCPIHGDTSCPFTLEDTQEVRGDDAA
jgi:hypothetical protein